MSQTAAPAPDVLRVRGLRFTGHHGVFAHERRDGQEFVVDLALDVDSARAAASDDLADTVDYGALTDQVRAVVEGEPVDLIETLADRIAQACLRPEGVARVEVTVHKPHAPVQARFDDVSLTITRSRP
ncbi:dihydroneopterin aldolase [Nocardioides marmoraquaticus]